MRASRSFFRYRHKAMAKQGARTDAAALNVIKIEIRALQAPPTRVRATKQSYGYAGLTPQSPSVRYEEEYSVKYVLKYARP